MTLQRESEGSYNADEDAEFNTSVRHSMLLEDNQQPERMYNMRRSPFYHK